MNLHTERSPRIRPHPFLRRWSQRVLGLFVLLVWPAMAQSPSPFQLLPQAQVSGAGVFLDQLVVGGETNASWHIRLCDPPAPGRSLLLSTPQLKTLIQSHLPSASGLPWSGAPTIQLTRKMRLLQSTELLAALTTRLQEDQAKQQGELELRFARSWIPVPIADEPFSVRVFQLPPSGLTSVMQLKFELAADQEILGSWQIPMEVRLWRQIWVCRQSLKRGQSLGVSDIALERRDVMKVSQDLLPSELDLEQGWQVVDNVNLGQPVLRRSIQPRIIVARGQVVDAFFRDGVMSIGMKAEALENGVPGQMIRVKNMSSHRELRGRVLNDQTVQIQM